MNGWPKRPDVGERPVVWESYTARPVDPHVGDYWNRADGNYYVWDGENWVYYEDCGGAVLD